MQVLGSTYPLPFAALLDVLRARGLDIGIDAYAALGRLISRYDGTSPEELRSAIAALLARDRNERAVIISCFDDLFVDRGAPVAIESAREEKGSGQQPDTGVRRKSRLSRWQMPAILTMSLVLGALIVPLGLALRGGTSLPPAPLPPTLAMTNVLPVPHASATPSDMLPKPGDPSVVFRLEWGQVTTAAAFGFIAALGVAMSLRQRTRLRAWAGELRQFQLGQVTGPQFYRLRADDRRGDIPRDVVDDVATILSRRQEVSRTSHHLDVPQSLRYTLRAGGRPHLVFQPPCRTLPVLVLLDVGPEQQPWRGRIDRFLIDLERHGIPLARYYFDATPSTVWRSTRDQPIPLDTLAKSADDAALLVISSGAGLRSAFVDGSSASLVRLLEKWPARSWVTPLTSRSMWRSELDRLPMTVWPMTAGGLYAAARDLVLDAAHRSSASPGALAGARPVTADDVERVKRLIAMAPAPVPVEVIDALRAQFTPDVPTDVLLHVLAESEELDTTSVTLPIAEQKRLLAAQRHDGPAREAAVRRVLLGMLEASEPPPGSLAHLRWQTDVALHQVQAANGETPGLGAPIRSLETLLAGPLGDEVRLRTARTVEIGRSTPEVSSLAREELSAPGPTSVDTSSGSPSSPRLLTPPRVADLVAASLVAIVASGAFLFAGGGSHAVNNLPGALGLEWQASQAGSTGDPSAATEGTLRMSIRRPDVLPPTTGTSVQARLIRQESVIDTVALSRDGAVMARPLSRADGGAWYQLQAPMPEGNLALSESVWVPGRVEPGRVLATFVSAATRRPVAGVGFALVSSSGAVVTGRADQAVPVPPGSWNLDVTQPGYASQIVPITIASNVETPVTVTLTPDASVTAGGLQFFVHDVYNEPVHGQVSIAFKQAGVALQANSSPQSPGMAELSGVQWGNGPVQVSVNSRLYEPASFALTGRPGEITVSRQTLLMNPNAATSEVPQPNYLPQLLQRTLGNPIMQTAAQVTYEELAPLSRANLLNVFTRAQKLNVTLERPQGTFSSDLWSMVARVVRVDMDTVQVQPKPDTEAYLDTWIRLGRRDPVQSKLLAKEPDSLVVPGRSVDLVLRLDPKQPSGPILFLSLRPKSYAATPHPYLIHQLLVLDGYEPPYRISVQVASKAND